MNINATMLICTRNGARTIKKALECCDLQILDKKFTTEILVIDNGSTDNTVEIIERFKSNSKYFVRLIKENNPGKINAFIRGIHEAKGSIIAIIDDDNYINLDFISKAIQFFEDYQELGIIGSDNQIISSLKTPDWFNHARSYYACSSPHFEKSIIDEKGRFIGEFSLVAGAGMVFKKQPLINILKLDYKFYNDTQRGAKAKITGEDTELCFLFKSLGLKFGFDPLMTLVHDIQPNRLSKKYLRKLISSIGAGSVAYEPFYQLYTENIESLKWYRKTWQWILFIRLRSFFNGYKIINNINNLEERQFKLFEKFFGRLGAIRRIIRERERYNKHFFIVLYGQWNKLRKKADKMFI